MSWEVVIGLEIHTQLSTRSKIFSGASSAYGAAPNTQACLVDLGYPGVLPVVNEEVIRMATAFGLAVNATVARRSVFARKNYFYPDLPKGYQISQYELPIVENGELFIATGDAQHKRIGITRAHLEEDAGKSIHEGLDGFSGIDLNRAGTPLLEIVSAPDLRSAQEAAAYMRKIHSIVRYLGISDGNLQEGSLRCDANVSVRRLGIKTLGTRTEIKNLNSFRFLEKAIHYEAERQIDVIEDGGEVRQETRLYDAERNETRAMRAKEEANDYRYFPDPDLLPVLLDEVYIEAVRQTLPELPDAKAERFVVEYAIKAEDAGVLTASRPLAEYFERSAALAAAATGQLVANWVTGELAAALNRDGLEIGDSRVSPQALAALLDRVADGTISGKIAKQVFAAMWSGEGSAEQIIARRGLEQITDRAAIAAVVDRVIAAHPEQVAEFRAGKTRLMGFFVGQVMRVTAGKASPAAVNELLRGKLSA